LLCRARLEFQGHEPLVAHDPGVVPRLDHIRLTGTDLGFRAVLVPDGQSPGLDDADVPNLAAIGADDRLDAL
jgi:hypothetical protein